MAEVNKVKRTGEGLSPKKMRQGINYSVGLNFVPDDADAAAVYQKIIDSLTPEKIESEMREIISLGCDSVRIYGDSPEKLLSAAEIALNKGLQVWISPRFFHANMDETLAALKEFAGKVEGLRARLGKDWQDKLILVLGNEISLDSSEVFDDKDYLERIGRYFTAVIFQQISTRLKLKKVLQGLSPKRAIEEHRMRVIAAEMIKKMAATVRPVFKGKTTYASLPQEEIDWDDPNIDIVGVNLYNDMSTLSDEEYQKKLDSYKGHKDSKGREKPVAVTEFGTSSYRGASWLGGSSSQQAINWRKLKPKRPLGVLPIIHNQQGQIQYLEKMIKLYKKHEIDAAFIFEFVDRVTEITGGHPALEKVNISVKPSIPEVKGKERHTMKELSDAWQKSDS